MAYVNLGVKEDHTYEMMDLNSETTGQYMNSDVESNSAHTTEPAHIANVIEDQPYKTVGENTEINGEDEYTLPTISTFNDYITPCMDIANATIGDNEDNSYATVNENTTSNNDIDTDVYTLARVCAQAHIGSTNYCKKKTCKIIPITLISCFVIAGATIGVVLTLKHQDINECDSNPCVNGGTCVNPVNSYACTCVGGYTGTNCQTDINECDSNPCVNGGTCVNRVNSYACTCVGGYTGTNCQTEQYDCAGYRKEGVTKSGVYNVTLWKTKSKIQVFCDMTTDGGGWTVFQNRFNGSVDFYQNFASYENGFGHLSGEFWLGLKYVQEMTLMSQTELRVDLRAADESTAYEVFQNFRLTEGPDYKLNIDPGTGTAGNSAAYGLSFNNDSRFSTFDRDAYNCALNWHGGWWYSKCSHVNLNGHYAVPGTSSSYMNGWGGMIYYPFKQTDSLKSSKMMLRRVT